MTYQATVVTVMIAGPEDVSVPKGQIRQALAQWNAINTESLKIVLVPVSWDTNTAPSMHAPAQTVINDTIPDFDILVAVFWTRLGSPTEHAASGTVEEIEKSIRDGKETMVYFSNEQLPPASIDLKQLEALMAFKNALFTRGLCNVFETPADLREKFQAHVHKKIQGLLPTLPALRESRPPTAPSMPTLSPEEQDLLLSAVSGDGTVIHLITMGGIRVETSVREFSTPGDARSEAKWRSVVKGLAAKGLIEDRRGIGELYFVTDKGYEVAEILDPEVTA